MSILIKGMEMPKTCDDCRLRCFSLLAKMNCPITGADVTNQQYAKERHPNCPIIEVHTPHGRLIDADKLIAFITNGLNRKENPMGFDAIEILTEIEYAPIIIEAEVSE